MDELYGKIPPETLARLRTEARALGITTSQLLKERFRQFARERLGVEIGDGVDVEVLDERQ